MSRKREHNFVVRTTMKISKQTKYYKEEIRGWEETSSSQPFYWLATDKIPNGFANSPSGYQDTRTTVCVSYFTGHVLASSHHNKCWRWSVRCSGFIMLWHSSSSTTSARWFGSGEQVQRVSTPACPSKPSSALYHRVASRCKVMESAPSVLHLVQATWRWSEGKSMKYIQDQCPHFPPLIIPRNMLLTFQNHLSTKVLFLPAWNSPLQVISEWKGQSPLWSFERQEKESGKTFLCL